MARGPCLGTSTCGDTGSPAALLSCWWIIAIWDEVARIAGKERRKIHKEVQDNARSATTMSR
jgi:hypothetical protein